MSPGYSISRSANFTGQEERVDQHQRITSSLPAHWALNNSWKLTGRIVTCFRQTAGFVSSDGTLGGISKSYNRFRDEGNVTGCKGSQTSSCLSRLLRARRQGVDGAGATARPKVT